jgi:glyoxylase-like metal-dependent hydrolase (beta-lactamase superfamily II)
MTPTTERTIVAAHTYASVPSNGLGPPIPEAGYLVEEIGENLFWVTDGYYMMMFLVTEDGVVAVDAPPTIGRNILRAIKAVTNLPVTHAIYSHAHADHAGAMVLYENATMYAQEEAAVLLKRDNDANRPLPSQIFTDSLRLEVGGEVLQLDYHGPNHCPGNIFIYAPIQETLMLVDVIFPGWVPFACLAVSQDIPAWIHAPLKALDYPFKTFVGGHLNRLGSREDVKVHHEFILDLKSECENAIDTFDLGSVFSQVDPINAWAVFRAYFDGVCAQAAGALSPRWIDRLGGLEPFADLNAFVMTESLRLDAGHLGPFGIHD